MASKSSYFLLRQIIQWTFSVVVSCYFNCFVMPSHYGNVISGKISEICSFAVSYKMSNMLWQLELKKEWHYPWKLEIANNPNFSIHGCFNNSDHSYISYLHLYYILGVERINKCRERALFEKNTHNQERLNEAEKIYLNIILLNISYLYRLREYLYNYGCIHFTPFIYHHRDKVW